MTHYEDLFECWIENCHPPTDDKNFTKFDPKEGATYKCGCGYWWSNIHERGWYLCEGHAKMIRGIE